MKALIMVKKNKLALWYPPMPSYRFTQIVLQSLNVRKVLDTTRKWGEPN